MYSKYKNLSDREKNLILAAVVLIIFFSFYVIRAYIPNLFSRSLGSQVETDAKKFNLLIPKITKLNELNKQNLKHTNVPGNNLFKYLSGHEPKLDVLNEDKIILVDVGAGQKVSVKYQAVGFDSFIQWINDLHIQYGVVVEELNMTPDPKLGYVAVSATLGLSS